MDVVLCPPVRRHWARWEIAPGGLSLHLTDHTILNAATRGILPIHRMQAIVLWRESDRAWCRLWRILIRI